MAYTVEHIVVPVDCVIVVANKKWIEPGKFLWRQPTPNKVKAMIKQLEEMTLTEKVRATTLLAWRWPSAWKRVRETMHAQELKVKKETRKAAKKAVLKPKAVAKGNTKVARTLRRFPEGDRKDCDELILSPAQEMLKETLKKMCRPAPVVMAVSLPDPLPPRVSAAPGTHKGKVYIRGGCVCWWWCVGVCGQVMVWACVWRGGVGMCVFVCAHVCVCVCMYACVRVHVCTLRAMAVAAASVAAAAAASLVRFCCSVA
jgi:hypothetical protein